MTDEVIKKRKRMESNRESARRSRMRKQKHLEDLTAQISLLRRNNGRISATLQATTREWLSVEAENTVLSAQLAELSTRLDSLNGILSYMSSAGAGGGEIGLVGSHWSSGGFLTQQPIVASADYHVFGY